MTQIEENIMINSENVFSSPTIDKKLILLHVQGL